MLDWIHDHGALLRWLTLLSVVTLLLSILLLPVVVARIPQDYFLHPEPPPDSFRDRHPVLRYAVRALKNVFGVLFLVTGFALIFLPGQGALMMFVGLLLVDFPSKRRVELWLVRKKPVRTALNWLRKKAGAPPLEVNGVDDSPESDTIEP